MENEILAIFTPIAALVGVGLTIPILVQFVNNVSRNMSLTNTNSTEEISKTSRQP
jgi:hypothetical protein